MQPYLLEAKAQKNYVQKYESLRVFCAQVVLCAVSPKGDNAVTATEDHRLQIWELPSGRQLHDLAVKISSLHIFFSESSTYSLWFGAVICPLMYCWAC